MIPNLDQLHRQEIDDAVIAITTAEAVNGMGYLTIREMVNITLESVNYAQKDASHRRLKSIESRSVLPVAIPYESV